MQDKGVGLCEVHGPLTVVGAEAGIELCDTQIGEKEDVGGEVADAESICKVGGFKGSTKRTQPHADAGGLRCLGQMKVDPLGLGCPTGHGRNQQWKTQSLSEEACGKVDFFEGEFRQCIVDKSVALKAGCQLGKVDVLFQVDAQMFQFSLLQHPAPEAFARNFQPDLVLYVVVRILPGVTRNVKRVDRGGQTW